MKEYVWSVKNKANFEKDLVKTILKSRKITDIKAFLNPIYPITFAKKDRELKKLIDINIKNAVKIVQDQIKKKGTIIIHGDYDADGQTATAILFRTIYNDLKYKNVIPYIPDRFEDGYGLSQNSISAVVEKLSDNKGAPPLLITVDCGIVSNEEILSIKKEGFKVIITDHHKTHDKKPKADEIIHTEKTTGAGIAWLFGYFLKKSYKKEDDKYLDLAAIGTVCDLQPLTELNRQIVTMGLRQLSESATEGLKALQIESNISKWGTYEIGWIIGPQINATGRLTNAMESLTLLCTDSKSQATKIAKNMYQLNKQRQDATQNAYKFALSEFENTKELPKFLVTSSKTYHEGIIGLVAGKLTQTYYRSSIAISIDEKTGKAKGSARSITGISIIDTLRKFEHLFDSVGGHDTAAGFSLDKGKIAELKTSLNSLDDWSKDIFSRKLKIDCEIPFSLINQKTYDEISRLEPFGIGNAEPVFLTKKLKIYNMNRFGQENKHLKLYLQNEDGEFITAIAFGKGELALELSLGDIVDIAYSITLNEWNGERNIEMRVKDIKKCKKCPML